MLPQTIRRKPCWIFLCPSSDPIDTRGEGELEPSPWVVMEVTNGPLAVINAFYAFEKEGHARWAPGMTLNVFPSSNIPTGLVSLLLRRSFFAFSGLLSGTVYSTFRVSGSGDALTTFVSSDTYPPERYKAQDTGVTTILVRSGTTESCGKHKLDHLRSPFGGYQPLSLMTPYLPGPLRQTHI